MENLESGKITSFTKLVAWQEGHSLVLMVYKAVKKFPRDELFGLTSQIKRAVVSITSNIAEGFSRYTYKDKTHFYYIALGSLTETQNQIIIAKDVGYISESEFCELIDKVNLVSKILYGLIKKSSSYI
jgi:four helix bundle protein